MATRKRSDRAARGQAQERSPKTMGDPTTQEQAMQASPQPVEAAQTQGITQDGSVSPDDVARRAYDLYQQRGSGDGGDLDDWLQAERDLQRG
jgi:hypothetical protein